MKRMAIGLAGVLLASGAATADTLYTCTDPATGRLIISQMACAGDAREIDVRVTRPTAAQLEQTRQREAATVEHMNTVIEMRREARRVANLHAQRVAAERARDHELAELASRRATARNNLAGAVYLDSLAQRERAVVDRYNQQIQTTDAQLQDR